MKKITLTILILIISLISQGQNVKLVSCTNIYKDDFPKDYKDKNIEVQYLVNQDTTDQKGYINIKKGNLYRQLIIEDFVVFPICAKPILAFYNSDKVAFLSNCMTSKYLLVIDLKCEKCDDYLEPYFISNKDSLLIYQKDIGTKIFYISDLNFKILKTINLKDMYDCGNTHDCFEKISCKNKIIKFVYLDKKRNKKILKIKAR